MIAADRARFEPHPLDRVRPGDLLYTWCSRCMEREPHLWTGTTLICLICHPEQMPLREADG